MKRTDVEREAASVPGAAPGDQASPADDARASLAKWPRRAEGMLEVPFDRLGALPGALDLIRDRVIDGVVVPDFYSAAEAEAVTARFWAEADDIPNNAPFGKPPQVFCRPLTTTEDADEYLRMAPVARAFVDRIFAGLAPFEPRLEAALGALARRPVRIPKAVDGRDYCPATLRTLPTGHGFAPHFGNAFLFAETCAHLRSLMRCEMHLSYFTPLALPPSGGELVLYPIEWADAEDGKVDGVPVEFAPLFSEGRTISLKPGDLIVFDGSRILHAITPVAPGPVRVTLGGFLGFTADDTGIVYWS